MSIPDRKDMSLPMIGRRMGQAMAAVSRIPTEEYRHIIMQSLTDMPILLKEIKNNIPSAEAYGHLTIENEELKEEIRVLREVVEEQRYEEKLKEYSSCEYATGVPYCGY